MDLDPGDVPVLDQLPGGVGLYVEAQADHYEPTILAERLVDLLQVRHLGQAGRTPRRPEIQQDILTPVVLQPQRLAVEAPRRQGRGRDADLDIGQDARLQGPLGDEQFAVVEAQFGPSKALLIGDPRRVS